MDGVPGFVPRVLRDPDVSLFRADDRVFEAMVDGWRSQMLARGLAVDTIKARTGVVGRFQAFTGDYPWTGVRWTSKTSSLSSAPEAGRSG
ncbi:hypothetical protein OHA70_25565 [Kribbella sp. NBC_00382]|uniref:hypothetical protein n=1 Tax=Kribbella sp. NBC_00382 TaxID=2975967 RepID=UPI002E239F74